MSGDEAGSTEDLFRLALSSSEAGEQVSDDETARVLRRAGRASSALQGARLLWVAPNHWKNKELRSTIESLGVSVSTTDTSAKALAMLRDGQYDVILSSDYREGHHEGAPFAQKLVGRGYRQPLIFWVSVVELDLRSEPNVLGVTNRPHELLHYLIDALERVRG
jgi:hypothetical protein